MKTTLIALLLAAAAAPNLLTSAQLRRDEKVLRSAVIRDGQAPAEGDNWDSELTAVIQPGGLLELDLGQVTPVAAALIQADNNDTYVLWGSRDGTTFEAIWRAGIENQPGMRSRVTRTLTAEVRYVRITAEGGDQAYSLGEVQLFSNPADLTDTTLIRKAAQNAVAPPPPPTNTTTWIILGVFAAIVVFFFLPRRKVGAAADTKPAGDDKADEKSGEKAEEKSGDKP